MDGASQLANTVVHNHVENPTVVNSTGSFMFIGELSSATGVDAKTIRYYEREGLLSPPRHGRFRTYMESDVNRLKNVLAMRRMGLAIVQIRHILTSDLRNLADNKIVSMLFNHLETLRNRQAEVTRQLEATTAALHLCEKA
jgi:DNA-binding transcriptional MerR regulator